MYICVYSFFLFFSEIIFFLFQRDHFSFFFRSEHNGRRVVVCLPTQDVASRNINESKPPPHFMCQKRSSTHTRHVSYTHLHALLALTMLTRTFLDTQQQVSATPSPTRPRPPPRRDQPTRTRPPAARQHRLRCSYRCPPLDPSSCPASPKIRGIRSCAAVTRQPFITVHRQITLLLILFLSWSISPPGKKEKKKS